MIAISITDEYLDLRPGTTLNINEANPIFDRDSISRTFSYPFKLPDTAKNKRLLGQLDRLDSHSTNFSISGKIWIDRVPYEEGIIKVTASGNNHIEIRFENNEQDLLSTLDNIKVNEILDTVNVAWTGTALAEFDYYKNGSGEFTGLYRIQIDGNIYFHAQSLPTTGSAVNDYFQPAINADYPGFADTSDIDTLRLAVSLYPSAVIQYDGLMQLILTTGHLLAEDKLNSFHDMVTANLADPDADYVFPTIKNKSFYGGKNDGFLEYVNFWSGGSFITNIQEESSQWLHTYVPMIKLRYVFSKIIESTPISSISGTYYDLEETQNLIIYNNVAVDEVTFANWPGSYFPLDGDRYLNHYKQQFSLNDHLPEMTAREFINIFLYGFQLYARIKGDKLIIYKTIDQIAAPAIDWSDKANPEYTIQRTERKGFQIELSEDKDDIKPSGGQLAPITIRDGEIKKTIPFGTLVENSPSVTLPTFHNWLIPEALQKGTSDAADTGKGNYSFRLLYYRGLHTDSHGNDYPLAQYSAVDYDGASTGDLSLDINGTKGLYNLNMKGVVELDEKDEVTIPLRLTLGDILLLKKWENSKRKIVTEKGAFTGIIKSVQFLASSIGISEAKIIFKKL